MRYFLIPLLLLAADARASDRGIQAELVSASVTTFCSIPIAKDLSPIVKKRHMLAIAKMGQASLAAELQQIDEMWRAIASKYVFHRAQRRKVADLRR